MTAGPPTAGGDRDSTERRFLDSTVASWVSLAVRLAVGFAARVILARLLLPEVHGLYEEALRIVIIASAVRDLGLRFHLIRDPRRPYGTVLAFSIANGVLVTGLLVLAAPLFAGINPELPLLLRVYAAWVLLDGVVQAPKAYFERELRIGRMAAPEILRGIAMAAVSVGLAAAGWGVWSFVAGDLVAAAVFAALVWRRARGRMPMDVDLGLIPDLLRRSWLLFAIWGVIQVATYIDVFIVEVYGTTAMVGQYARAYMVAFLVPQIVAPRALLPALVSYRDDAGRFFAAFRVGTAFLMFFQVTAGWFLFFNAERVVAILLGPQWGPAVPLLKVLCFVPFLDVFTDLGGEVLKVRDEDRLWLTIMIVNLVSLVTVGVLFTQRWGAIGMAAANFFYLGNLLMAWRMARIFAAGFRRLMADLVYLYLVPVPFFAVAAAVFPPGSWGRLLLSGVAALAAGAVLALRFHRPFRDFFRAAGVGAGSGPET